MQVGVRKAASPSDPSTWSDYESAQKAVDDGIYDGVGFVFAGNDIIGIDIDIGFDQDGFPTDTAVDIISACNSFTERSRSGRGFHIYLRGNLPFNGRNNRRGCEIYKSGRFFIVTGKDFMFTRVESNQEAIDYIVEKYFPDAVSEGGITNKLYVPEWIPPHDGIIPIAPYYPPIIEGGRNMCMTSLGGQLFRDGYDEGDVYRELLRANSVACEPPLPMREIKSIVSSLMRYNRSMK